MKNIVICCDGTNAEYQDEDQNTNVVRLYELLGPDGDHQISYYDPGLGTHSPARIVTARWWDRLKMLAWGVGITAKVESAYRYLMDYYEPGDRVFLFGYSRGAYTVRLLSVMLHRVGLLTHGSYNLIPYARKINRRAGRGTGDRVARRFKASFSRVCRPHFIGVFDTVASVGAGPFRQYYRDWAPSPDVRFACQALSIDEKRRHFRAATWDDSDPAEGQMIRQVWFPGYHADVGGQGADRHVSDITLEWMLLHATEQGLVLRNGWRDSMRPNPNGDLKTPPWFLRLPGMTELRPVEPDAEIHSSVLERRNDPRNRYEPPNLPDRYRDDG